MGLRYRITQKRPNYINHRQIIHNEKIKAPTMLSIRSLFQKCLHVYEIKSPNLIDSSCKKVIREFEESEDTNSDLNSDDDIPNSSRSNSMDTLANYKCYDPILNTDKRPLKSGNNRFLYIEKKNNPPPELELNSLIKGDVVFKENKYLPSPFIFRQRFKEEGKGFLPKS
jgi:hypothetical protein